MPLKYFSLSILFQPNMHLSIIHSKFISINLYEQLLLINLREFFLGLEKMFRVNNNHSIYFHATY